MVSNVLWLFNDMLSLKTDVNVHSVRNKQKKLREYRTYFLLASWKPLASRIRSPVYPKDPYQNVTDPEHWLVRSWILSLWVNHRLTTNLAGHLFV